MEKFYVRAYLGDNSEPSKSIPFSSYQGCKELFDKIIQMSQWEDYKIHIEKEVITTITYDTHNSYY